MIILIIPALRKEIQPMQKIFRILLYLSLAFFVWYLYRADYLVFENIAFDPAFLVVSFLLLFTGFLLICISWGLALRLRGHRVGWTDAIKSQGIYVFAKYIPGKFWAVMGRASWFTADGSGLKALSLVSLQEQMVFLWWGLVLSMPATFLVLQRALPTLVIAAATAIFTILLFSGRVYRNFSGIINRLFKKEWEFKPMRWSFFLRVSLPVLLFWALWSAGFWLLMASMFEDIPIRLALVFPAGMTFGFLVIFLPAGLGVREGILAAFLIAGGLSPANAATVSVVSRFWFISGEIFLFLLAWALRLTGTGQPAPSPPGA
jgi:glycosyltransferase 2 family protein